MLTHWSYCSLALSHRYVSTMITSFKYLYYVNRLVQERLSNSSALAEELRVSCTNPSICYSYLPQAKFLCWWHIWYYAMMCIYMHVVRHCTFWPDSGVWCASLLEGFRKNGSNWLVPKHNKKWCNSVILYSQTVCLALNKCLHACLWHRGSQGFFRLLLKCKHFNTSNCTYLYIT